jgi:hypothetical protein
MTAKLKPYLARAKQLNVSLTRDVLLKRNAQSKFKNAFTTANG